MKNRKYKKISSGIYRVLIMKKGKWSEPNRGKQFFVRKTVANNLGKSLRVSRQFNDYQSAVKFRDGRIHSKVVSEGERMSFSNLVEEWKINILPHRSLATQVRYKSYFKHFKFFDGWIVSEITTAAIDAYISHLKTPEYLVDQNSTRLNYRHELSLLKLILDYYISRFNGEYRHPFLKQHALMAKVKEGKEKIKGLTAQDLEKFLTALQQDVAGSVDESIYYLACLQYALCARVQEVAAIHFEDFDLKNNQVNVDKKIVWPRAKGLEPLLAQGSKTNEGKRIPLSELGLNSFRQWTLKSGIRKGLLFKSPQGKPLSYRQIEYRYTKALKNSGLPFRGTHLLRHASLTELYSLTSDIKVVAQFAGHASIKTTEVYAKARSSKMSEATALLDEKLKGLSAIGSKSASENKPLEPKVLEFKEV